MSAAALDQVSATERPAAEVARIAALHRFAIQALLFSKEAEQITNLLIGRFGVKAVSLAFMDGDMLRFKPKVPGAKGELPRNSALCRETIATGKTIVVEDLTKDARFRDNSNVTTRPYLRFFASAPIKIDNEYSIGALVLVDTEPRHFPNSSTLLLEQIADRVVPWLLNPSGRTSPF
ncbi:GAF domain-containing protein [Flaviflagellibacter deserti]|uniref:GAF domain-containing protein n=1 Tax=Flaviflagellibacter deserti TaxID=2267266 RepID=A0ABV9YZA7_9HYPH